MTTLNRLYGHSLALLTDLYQLTMAYGYWKAGIAEREATFHLFFRRNPFGGGFGLAAGLASAVDYLRTLRFDSGDLDYLATLTGNDGAPLFEQAFLDYLAATELSIDVDAVAEGTLMFPHEPIVRVRGPILQCQIIETPLLNLINFQTLIATKSARICDAAKGEPVLEFGLRRAQGVDGALSASRAAYIGGAAATSNVLAGRLYGIPVKGTHAHSWVMCFDDEESAFRSYAEAMPNNCVFLVDTYDTVEGVAKAIEVGVELRAKGHEMVGIRLDSGDLAHLSIKAREMLDEAGFPNAAVVASNDLDENVITSLKQQGATIAVWGVGTKLVTAYDQPALGGVYKLSAIKDDSGVWQHKIKLSEQAIKISNPGVQQVRRYYAGNEMIADTIYDVDQGVGDGKATFDISDPSRRRSVPAHDSTEDLLEPVFRGGKLVAEPPTLEATRTRAREQLDKLSPRSRRLMNPQEYPVGLSADLHRLKYELVARARGESE
jgi:nicotinate phosphoribosyltransferase